MTITAATRTTGPATTADDMTALAERIFADIAAFSPDVAGVSRPAYSEVESRTLDYLEAVARDHQLATWRDAGANLVIASARDQDRSAPAGYFGSHVDSVPEGGNFDGLAGVVAALLTLITLERSGHRPSVPMRVLALRGEESAWFGHAYMASLALFGRLGPKALATKRRGGDGDLADAMRRIGLPVDDIAAGRPLLDASSVKFFLELHIEQGPVLVDRQWPVAAVTGIRGNVRHRDILCQGEAGHSGAVPRWLRRDAVFATSELIMRMDDHWTTILQHGGDLVLTAGIFHTDAAHNAMSRIPGETRFSFEARSQHPATLRAIEGLLHSEAGIIERDRKVRFVFDDPVHSQSAELDQAIIDTILAACREEGLPAETIASGAGHDAAVFAQAGIPTGMIFVRNRNGSHNPNEHMDIADLMSAVGVMVRVAKDLTQ
jgi:beta-ureidopropionase / N-carbamoyl-L-amino-acid hydrolase